MRQIRRTEHELILRFCDKSKRRLGQLARRLLGALGALGLGLGLWLGFQQTPLAAAVLTLVGSLLLLADIFLPRLQAEIATCIFNRSRNKLTVIHELSGGGALRDRNVLHYALSDIVRIDVYRLRSGWFRNTYAMVIELLSQSPRGQEPTRIRLDGLHDRILIQRGRLPVKLLTKEISYHLGRRMQLSWTYVEVPEALDRSRLGRRVIPRSSVQRLAQIDIRRMAKEVEQYIRPAGQPTRSDPQSDS
ncbi:MAG: hypothetical protein F6J97_17040 [Leptolyngbya sp. SIO4C1]|nr:hypothetical protein [Leptolyngbya sp. SIO4C1]